MLEFGKQKSFFYYYPIAINNLNSTYTLVLILVQTAHHNQQRRYLLTDVGQFCKSTTVCLSGLFNVFRAFFVKLLYVSRYMNSVSVGFSTSIVNEWKAMVSETVLKCNV